MNEQGGPGQAGAGDQSQVILQLVELLGIEMVTKMLTDDQYMQSVAAFVDVVKQLQPEQKQELLSMIQQMTGGGGQEQPAAEPSAQMFPGEQPQKNAFY